MYAVVAMPLHASMHLSAYAFNGIFLLCVSTLSTVDSYLFALLQQSICIYCLTSSIPLLSLRHIQYTGCCCCCCCHNCQFVGKSFAYCQFHRYAGFMLSYTHSSKRTNASVRRLMCMCVFKSNYCIRV